jgi:hypothetical protein
MLASMVKMFSYHWYTLKTTNFIDKYIPVYCGLTTLTVTGKRKLGLKV